MDEITEDKWETCRGLGFSFGYNQVETEDHTIGEAELIHLLADIVSKNGNLLLNAGPMADGTIPELQACRLKALGQWLGKNGDAIYGTRPWTRATGETAEGTPVRFTTKDDALYAIVLGQPSRPELRLEIGAEGESADVSIVGDDRAVEASYADGTLALRLPDGLGEEHAHAFRIGKA